MTGLQRAEDYRRRADECEQEAARAKRLVEVRQYRVLAQAWRELADLHEARAAGEPRSFGDGD